MPAALDETFYPILLTRIEEPLTRGEAEGYFQQVADLADRAIGRGERYVVIVASGVVGFSPAARKMVADVQGKYITPERNAVTLTALVPFDDALVRGMVTALRWIAPTIVDSIQPVRTFDDAVDEALRTLKAHGAPFRGDVSGLCRALGLRPR